MGKKFTSRVLTANKNNSKPLTAQLPLLQKVLNDIPHTTGVYRFYSMDASNNSSIEDIDSTTGENNCNSPDANKDVINENGNSDNIDGSVLYVGKAIDLHKRVKSYFQATSKHSPRISLMVSKIARIEFTITDNEKSALILESNLIKALKPKYNIIFRDDKTYVLIALSKHQFPRIASYRGKINRQNNYYFGPYPNTKVAKQAIDLITRIFKLRTCNDNYFSNRSRACLLYQINRCSAPCVNMIAKEQYTDNTNQAIAFLQGRFITIINSLTSKMHQAAKDLDFEQAVLLRERIKLIKELQTTQIISEHNQALTCDIILHSISHEQKRLYIYIIMLRNGLYTGDWQHIIHFNYASDLPEHYEVFLHNYYAIPRDTVKVFTTIKHSNDTKQFLKSALGVQVSNNLSGRVKELAKMGLVNLRAFMAKNDAIHAGNDLLSAAQSLALLLGIDHISRIECFDVSHHHGSSAVASLVVYLNGAIAHDQFKLYNLPADYSGDDILALSSVLNRRLADNKLPIPQVILIDGGLNQYKAIKNIIIQHELYDKIKVIAIFKGHARNPLYDRVIITFGHIIEYTNNERMFVLLHALRDEAHRFAIARHRKRQIKRMAQSVITDIPSIGSKKQHLLLKHFGDLHAIKAASVSDLQQVKGIGKILAQTIHDHLKQI